MTKHVAPAAVALVACLLTACGGGGGGGANPPPPPPPPPTGNVTLSGQVTFDRPGFTASNTLDFSNLQRLPVRGATLEVLRSSDQSILATSRTGETDGRYSVTVPAGSVIVRVKAQLQSSGASGYDFEIRNNTANNALYTLDSAVVNATTGTTLNLNAAPTGARAAAPFAILDVFRRAKDLLRGVEPGLGFPPLDVYWSTQNRAADCNGRPNPATGEIGTSFFLPVALPARDGCPAVPAGMYILGDATTPSADTDEFDASVIAHEFGHYFEDAFSRADSLGGPHALNWRHDLALAFSEGWGNAFQGFVLDSPVYRDTFGATGNASFAFDIEANSSPFTVETGYFSEASVQEFLWDVFDPVSAADSDAIDLGYAPIHRVMRDELRATAAVTGIHVMAQGLIARHPAQEVAIRQRLAQESIVGRGDFAENEGPVGANPATGAQADPNAVPVFRSVTLGVPASVVSTNRFGDSDAFWASFNRLGGRRYLRIDLPGGGGLTIVAQGPAGSDPDFVLLRAGVDQCPAGGACSGFDFGEREEAVFTNLPAGTYTLEVAECTNLGRIACGPNVTPRGDTPIDVTVTSP